jgi:hypothetical protein
LSAIEVIEVIQKFSKEETGSPELRELLAYFTRILPTIQNDWVMFPTENGADHFELMVFFKNENAVRKFKELAFACLGGPFITGIKFKVTSKDGRDQLVNSLNELGYFKYTQFEMSLRGSETNKRLKRLRQVSARSSSYGPSERSVDRGELGNFRQAISAGNHDQASDALEALKRGGLLSSINLCFLEFQLWYTKGSDGLIWGDERIEDVIRSSRPRVVTEFLLVSLWRHCAIGDGGVNVAVQNLVNATRMKLLLKSVVMPTTPEGRFCLAMVTALSDTPDSGVFSQVVISQDERDLLQEIISTKMIPLQLLGAGKLIVPGNETVEDFIVGSGEMLAKAEQFRDEADVRSLLKLIGLAHERGEFVEDVLRRLIRCVADENLPDFAVKTEEWISRLEIDFESWSPGLKSAHQRVIKMASIYAAGWSGLMSLGKQEFATYKNVIVESGSSWPISDFENTEFDSSFASWISSFDPEIIQNSILDVLLDRLNQVGTGVNTVNSILEFDNRSVSLNLLNINGSAGSLHRLLQYGESENLEFKSSLRSPMQGELPNKEIRNALEFSCVKSVAAMLHNKSGGKLLIGVSDSGECVGLEKDYESSEKIGNRDGFELHFRRVLQQKIEGLLPSEVKISFETVNNKDVAVILCPPASSPKYVNHENRTYLFVRDGNATIDLVSDIKKLVAFTTSRFTTSK